MKALLTKGKWTKNNNDKWYLEGDYKGQTIIAYANQKNIDEGKYSSLVDEELTFIATINESKNVFFISDFFPENVNMNSVFIKYHNANNTYPGRVICSIDLGDKVGFIAISESFLSGALVVIKQNILFNISLKIERNRFQIKDLKIDAPCSVNDVTIETPILFAKQDKKYYQGTVVPLGSPYSFPARIYIGALKDKGLSRLDKACAIAVSGKWNDLRNFYFISDLDVAGIKCPFITDASVVEHKQKKNTLVLDFPVADGVFAEIPLTKKSSNLIGVSGCKKISIEVGEPNEYAVYPLISFVLPNFKDSKVQFLKTEYNHNNEDIYIFNVCVDGTYIFHVSVFGYELEKNGFTINEGNLSLLKSQSYYMSTSLKDGRYLKIDDLLSNEYEGKITFLALEKNDDDEFYKFSLSKSPLSIKISLQELWCQGIAELDEGASINVRLKREKPSTYQSAQWTIKELFTDIYKTSGIYLKDDQIAEPLYYWQANLKKPKLKFDLERDIKLYFFNNYCPLVIKTQSGIGLLAVISESLLLHNEIREIYVKDELETTMELENIKLFSKSNTTILTTKELHSHKSLNMPSKEKSPCWLYYQSHTEKEFVRKEGTYLEYIFSSSKKATNDDRYVFKDWHSRLQDIPFPEKFIYYAVTFCKGNLSKVTTIIKVKKHES